jgi:hypothetical protein
LVVNDTFLCFASTVGQACDHNHSVCGAAACSEHARTARTECLLLSHYQIRYCSLVAIVARIFFKSSGRGVERRNYWQYAGPKARSLARRTFPDHYHLHSRKTSRPRSSELPSSAFNNRRQNVFSLAIKLIEGSIRCPSREVRSIDVACCVLNALIASYCTEQSLVPVIGNTAVTIICLISLSFIHDRHHSSITNEAI